MTEELLAKLRETVLEKKEDIEIRNREIDRIRELEENEIVKEYMKLRNLTKSYAFKLQEDDGLYYRAFNECKPEIVLGTNRMYVLSHIGHYLKKFRIREYRTYINVESSEEHIISDDRLEKFEDDNIILDGIGLVDAKKEFLKLAVEQGQEEAVKVMSKKYRRK